MTQSLFSSYYYFSPSYYSSCSSYSSYGSPKRSDISPDYCLGGKKHIEIATGPGLYSLEFVEDYSLQYVPDMKGGKTLSIVTEYDRPSPRDWELNEKIAEEKREASWRRAYDY